MNVRYEGFSPVALDILGLEMQFGIESIDQLVGADGLEKQGRERSPGF